jgi:exodeoxyribonuclease VII large subunit
LRARLDLARRRFGAAHLRVRSFDFRAKMAALRLGLQRRSHDLAARAERVLRWKRERWEKLSLQLQERSPLKVLERGYAIATDATGNVLRDAEQVSIGDEVKIQLHRGRLSAGVKSKES